MASEFDSPSQLLFLDLTDDDKMTASERKTLSHIMQPSSLPLPGTEGKIWRTPRNSSPEVEFGDGVSAVFKSLSVSSKTEPSRHVLSANTAPFVPSGIPIPLPTMGNGHTAPHSIHINNFTANLNYPLPPVNTMERNSPVTASPFMPGSLQYPQFMPVSSVYEGGHYPHYQHPMVLIHPSYQALQPQPQHPHPVAPGKEESPSYASGGGITFGSTPVVSIRAGGQTRESRASETDESHSAPPTTGDSWEPPPVLQAPAPTLAPTPAAAPVPAPVSAPVQAPAAADIANHREHIEVDAINVNTKQNFKAESQSLGPALQTKNIENNELNLSSTSQSSSATTTEQSKPNQEQTTHQTSQLPKVEEEKVAEVEAAVPQVPEPVSSTPTPAPVSSWAGLFAPKSSAAPSEAAVKPTARITPFSATEGSSNCSGSDVDSSDRELGQFLNSYALKHLSSALLPRGLLNRSNWCFVNAILQALLASPPFYNMMKSLSTVVHPLNKEKSKTPMMDSILEFTSEFSVLDTHQINKPQKKDKNRKKEEIVTGISLEPIYVYNMLLNREDETFKVIEGRQEDAEEFLSFLLNGLSDEMLSKMKLVDLESAEEAEARTEEPDGDGEADDWKEVGAKGKSCVTRRIADSSQTATPIQSLALGMCRSCVKSETGDNSATLQPFYTLQLHIQDEHVNTLADALGQNFANEKLDGFICSRTKKEIEATRILSLEELPPVLILHLKRFVYDGKTGGVQKIMKQIDFGVDLEISKNILSAECRASNKQRQYKLFSVVYHNGREATKGHYVTDIFHTGYSSWLHCDDSQVTPTCEQSVLAPGPTSTPYLLFYRRGDTMLGMERKNMA